MTTCWCGSTDFIPFSPEYAECRVCGTLASLVGISPDELTVSDDETDFYGKTYWLDHQSADLGFPDIHKRARADITERNLHWLKTLLKYRLPGAKVLELGCSHGSFVGLMRHTGYDASGVEMSPWVVDFAKRTFDVPVFVGPIENLDFAECSIDVIVLMDVLEHLPNPVATMSHCLKLLKPDGVLIVQMPQFRQGIKYAEMVKTKAPFLEMLQADEHLYLFTEDAAARLFRQLGAEHLQFEQAIFDQYDMFFAVSRQPLQTNTVEQIESALAATRNGRISMALLELRDRELASLRDRIARGEQIETLTQMVKESEADRAARGEQIRQLTEWLTGSHKQVSELSHMVDESKAEVSELNHKVEESKAEVSELSHKVEESKAETAARDEEIYTLLADLRSLFGHRAFRLLAKLARWREANKLQNRIGQP
jgi:2-polyprenyl-3-methyl-5-hydroxy-6-metoxy-1,4-benzoquinol methylase